MFQLDDLVRPFVHKILLVIEPMLIDQDYYARMEAREIISNLRLNLLINKQQSCRSRYHDLYYAP